MKIADKKAVPFRIPPGVKLVRVSLRTGLRAQGGEPDSVLEAFKPYEEPDDAFSVIATGVANTGFGLGALALNNTGNDNSATGTYALNYNINGYNNTANGFQAISFNTSGYGNVGVGYQALLTNATGFVNTCIGDEADVTSSNLSNATAIGHFAKVSTSNSMVFGNAAVTKWGFGTNVTQAGAALQVGTFGTANGNGAYLTTGGAWTNNSSIHFKEDFSTLDKKQILDKISSLTISRWRYKGTANEYHIGPVA